MTYLACYIITNKSFSQLKDVVYLVSSFAIYFFGYLLELHSNTMQSALFWNQFQYISLPFVSSFWLVLALRRYGYIDKDYSVRELIIFIIPVITFFIRLTNQYHFFFYSQYTFELIGEMGILHLYHGPWYYVHYAYLVIQLVISNILFILAFSKSRGVRQRQMITLSAINFVSLCGVLITTFGVINTDLDFNAIVLPIPGIMFSYLIIKADVFNINAFARIRVFQDSDEGIIVIDEKNRIVDYNKKASSFFAEQGLTLSSVDIATYADTQPKYIQALMDTDKTIFRDPADSGDRFYEFSSTKIVNSYQRDCGYIKSIKEVTEEIKYQMALEYSAKIDDMSQLFNRGEFIHQAEECIKSANAKSVASHLMMLDIDRFKKINDKFGHQVGDTVIIAMSNLLKSSFRGEDIIGRFGGDEFVVMLSGVGTQDVISRAEEFRINLESIYIIPEVPDYQITVSAGIAVYQKGMTVDQLIGHADEALYSAKHRGRNRVELYQK